MDGTIEKMVSIVTPVYNVAPYLPRCINSILRQSYPDYQLILVDDGATDQSGALCDAYAAQHEKIEVYHQKNGGAAAARNAALRHVKGEYLLFLDADDELADDALEVLVQIMQETRADVAAFGWDKIEENGEMTQELPGDAGLGKNVSGTAAAEQILQGDGYFGGGYLWNKMWRTQSLRAMTGDIMAFDARLPMCEDKEWNLRNLVSVDKVALVPKCLYRYYRMPQSPSHITRQTEAWLSTMQAVCNVSEYYHQIEGKLDVPKSLLREADRQKLIRLINGGWTAWRDRNFTVMEFVRGQLSVCSGCFVAGAELPFKYRQKLRLVSGILRMKAKRG